MHAQVKPIIAPGPITPSWPPIDFSHACIYIRINITHLANVKSPIGRGVIT